MLQAGRQKIEVQGAARSERRQCEVVVQLQIEAAGADERFIEHGSYDSTWRQGVDIDNNHVPGVMYTNLQLSYRPLQRDRLTTEVYLDVSNLMNRDPPRATVSGASPWPPGR